MGDIADFYIDKMIDKHIDLKPNTPKIRDFWITKNGDAIRYEDLEESHARNILKRLESKKEYPHPALLKRIAYFDNLKKDWKDLF
jgi:hypothetical protein